MFSTGFVETQQKGRRVMKWAHKKDSLKCNAGERIVSKFSQALKDY